MILGVDTSLPALSLALVDQQRVVATLQLQSEGSRNEKLLMAVDWLLKESGVTLAAVQMIAVTRGPGSFTGVRVGLATVQGIAIAREVKLCALSTHHAVAFAHPDQSVLVHTDGGRGEYYAAAYDRTNEVIAPSLYSAAMLEDERPRHELVIDLTASLHRYNVAMWCALAAESLDHANALAQFADLTPVYVRLAEAEVKLKARQS